MVKLFLMTALAVATTLSAHAQDGRIRVTVVGDQLAMTNGSSVSRICPTGQDVVIAGVQCPKENLKPARGAPDLEECTTGLRVFFMCSPMQTSKKD